MDGFGVIGLRLDLIIMPVIAAVLIVVGVPLMVLGATKLRDRYLDMWGSWGFAGAIVSGLGAALLLVTVVLMVPFKSAYHHWYGATGTVESVTNIFEGGSGEVSPGYVVELDSVDKPLLFNDPRILRAQGEEIDVTCSVEWVPAGVDRLNCWIAG